MAEVEPGKLSFPYRPVVEEADPGGLEDVRGFYLVPGPSTHRVHVPRESGPRGAG